MSVQICVKCGIEKEVIDFYYRKDSDTYRKECKECTKKAKAIREAAPGVKEERARKERERRALHGEEINAKLRSVRSTPEGKAKSKLARQKLIVRAPEKVKAWSRANRHNRRVLKEANGLVDNAATITTWLLVQPKVCEYCGSDCKDNYQLDHIEALTQGGTHTIDNFAIACPTCNNSKHNHSLLVWLAKKKKEQIRKEK